jgi:hypothetical protein
VKSLARASSSGVPKRKGVALAVDWSGIRADEGGKGGLRCLKKILHDAAVQGSTV